MFNRKMVVRDTRSIFVRAFYKVKQLFSTEGTDDIPCYQICYERTNELTRNIVRTTFVVVVAFCSTVFFQTIQPLEQHNYAYQTASAVVHQTASAVVPQTSTNSSQVVVHDFPVNAKNNEQQRTHIAKTNKAKQCLAKNIYFEARSESMKGRFAVALVTFNRVKSSKFPDTVCGVVWQEHQFSWTHDGLSDKPNESRAWQYAKKIADFLLTNNNHRYVKDITGNATYYHAEYVSPYWKERFTKTASIGLHRFYTDEG